MRNSLLLGLFVEIIEGPVGTLRAVETVGRGVAGEARCTLNVVADKMTTSSDSPAEARRRSLACGAYRGRVASLCRLIDAVEIGVVGGPVRTRLAGHVGYTAIQAIPGVGPILAAGVARRDVIRLDSLR
ncbi:hypothetical protein AB0873_16415 [Micromonospora sp. NPDC047707]|uniref:hypothetical protein n=1 Tax=Micromonospora sp. NPDC047707 TaxID=3154498 RepID=UPI0034516B5B